MATAPGDENQHRTNRPAKPPLGSGISPWQTGPNRHPATKSAPSKPARIGAANRQPAAESALGKPARIGSETATRQRKSSRGKTHPLQSSPAPSPKPTRHRWAGVNGGAKRNREATPKAPLTPAERWPFSKRGSGGQLGSNPLSRLDGLDWAAPPTLSLRGVMTDRPPLRLRITTPEPPCQTAVVHSGWWLGV